MKQKLRYRTRVLGCTLTLVMAGFTAAEAQDSSSGWPEPDLSPVKILSSEAPPLDEQQTKRYRIFQALPETGKHRIAAFHKNLAEARVVHLPLPEDAEAVFVRDEVERRGEASVTWRGHVEGEPSTAVLVANDGELSGYITIDRHEEDPAQPTVLSIDPLGGGTVIVRQLDLKPLDALECGTTGSGAGEATAKSLSSLSQLPAKEEISSEKWTTNVLVVYTPAAQEAHGNIPLLAQLAVDQANQGYADRKAANLRLNLMAARLVEYEEADNWTADLPTDLARLQDPADGFMDVVHAWREELGADIVVLITGSLPSRLGGSAATILANKDNPFAVVLWNSAVGNLAFSHEVGHLQGAWHNPEVDSNQWSFPSADILRKTASTVAKLTTTHLLGWKFLWGTNNGTIDYWHFGTGDHLVEGDFDGDGTDELLAANSGSRYSHLMDFNGWSWSTQWSNQGNGWIGSWWLGGADRIIAGNFITGNNRDELLLINPQSRHAHLLIYQGGGWSMIWSNNGNGWIGSWWLGAADRFVSGPFDGGSGDELLAINKATQYSHLLRFTGSAWTTLWSNQGNNWIASWWLGSADHYLAGNFVTWNAGSELHAINPNGWSHTNRFQGSWNVVWSNGGSDWINGWFIGQNDVYIRGNFLVGNSRDEILEIAPNNGWSAIMAFDGANWQHPWNNFGSGNIGWWFIGYGDRCVAGDFASGDGRDELLCMQPNNNWSHMHHYSP